MYVVGRTGVSPLSRSAGMVLYIWATERENPRMTIWGHEPQFLVMMSITLDVIVESWHKIPALLRIVFIVKNTVTTTDNTIQ